MGGVAVKRAGLALVDEAKTIAAEKQLDLEEVARQTTANFHHLFKLNAA